MSRQEMRAIRARLDAAANSTAEFTVEGARATWFAFTDSFPVPPTLELAAERAGGCALEWIRRPAAPRTRALMYLHGGGYVCGTLTSHRPLTCELAAGFEGGVVSVDYRLAPEHPFPAAIDDAVAVYQHLLAQQLEPRHIAIGGDSAGGGLAIATLLALRARHLPLPGATLCISPWSDLTRGGATLESKRSSDPLVFPQALEASSRIYRAGQPDTDPLVSPALADLRGLPPLLIQVGSHEILLDDAVRLAREAGHADVEVVLEVWPEMLHVWHLFSPELSEGRDACARAARWLNEKLGACDALAGRAAGRFRA